MCNYQEWDKLGHKLCYCEQDVVANGLCAEHLAWVEDCGSPGVSKVDMKYHYRSPARKRVKLAPSTVVETILPPDPKGKILRAAFDKATGKKKTEAWKALLDYNSKRALEINAWRKPVERSEEDIQAGLEKLRAEMAQAKAESDEVERRQAAEAEKREERQKPLSKPAARKLWAEREAITKASPEYQAGVAAAQAETEKRAAEWKAAQEKMAALEPRVLVGTIPPAGFVVDTREPEAPIVVNPLANASSAHNPASELEIFGRFLILRPVAVGSSACAWFDQATGIKLAITLEGVKRMGPEVILKIVSRA
jgi:hypothetical protein